jgi:urease accessory protein
VELAEDARFIWFETFAPGRVASGEAWEFTRFESRFQVNYDDRPVARETYALIPGAAAVKALRKQFPNACHGACYAVGLNASDDLLAQMTTLHHANCWIGCTRLDGPAIAVRLVAGDNIDLSRTLTKVRELVHVAFGRVVPSLRRF